LVLHAMPKVLQAGCRPGGSTHRRPPPPSALPPSTQGVVSRCVLPLVQNPTYVASEGMVGGE
jgi:hypothetical protein